MFYELGQKTAAAQYGVGMALGGLGGLALHMLLDKDLRAELLQPGPGRKGVHPQVIKDATKLAPLLNHLDPAKARIAIGGLPRTGKTELASELARQLGMRHHDADIGMGLRGIPEGSIAERYDMLLNEDPEQFDALIHLSRPGAQHTPLTEKLWDLPGLEKAMGEQFDAARGHELRPTETARLKLRPQEGFGTKVAPRSFVNYGEVAKKVAPTLLGMLGGGAIAGALGS